MDLLTWLIVGLIAGVLASMVVGGTGYGIIGDIVVGIVGAFVGGWVFGLLGVTSPFGGLAGTIFTAFVGACLLLFVLRAVRRRSYRRRAYAGPTTYADQTYVHRAPWWRRHRRRWF